MGEKVRNKIIVLEPSTASVKELLALVVERKLADIVTVKTAEEAISTIVPALPCLFLSSINESNEVPASMQLLKRLEHTIKHQGLKVYMVTGIKNRQLSDLFTQKMGVTDYIIDPVPVRTMYFKINLAVKAVENFRKQQEIKRAAQEQIVIKKYEGKKPEPATEITTKGKPALQMAEDTFLFKNGGAKKVGKKFVVEVEGPEPSTGEWQQHADKGEAKSAWRWVPNEEKEAQASGKAPPDGWVHEGEKPAFNEETGKWSLASETPALALKKDGKVVAEKISLDEKGELTVAADSQGAEENLQKNRVKASAAIKEREERQKILVEKKKAAEKTEDAKASMLASLAEGDAGQLVPSMVEPVETAEKAPKAKKAAKKDGSAALQDLMNSVEADESDEPTEFNNHLDGKKEALRSVVDQREGVQIKAGAPEAPEEAAGAPGPAPAKKASPLDFLKKKKEQLQQAALTNEVNQIKADAPPKGVNALKESEEEKGPSAGILNRKKNSKGKSSPVDRLAQLRAELEEAPAEEEAAEDLPISETAPADEQEDDPPLAATGEKPGKKGSHNLKLKTGDEPGKKGSPALKLLEKKKKALESLKQKMLTPLPEEMSPEEEQETREELGLEGRPEIKVKELARKKRQAEVDRMKGLLAEIEEEMEEGGEAISAGQGAVADDFGKKVRKGDLSPEKLKGIRSAMDSLDSEEPADESDGVLKRKNTGAEPKGKHAALNDDALYMPEADLQPLGNAWESTEAHFVYLDATVRYKGFEKLEDVLPLWIFRGDQAPELLGKSKEWRFRGSLPFRATKVSDIPSDVRDFLVAIRDQLEANAKEDAEPAAEELAAGPKDKKNKEKKGSGSNALDRLKAQLSDVEEDAEELAKELSGEEPAEKDELSATADSKFKAGGELTLPGEDLDGLKARRGKGAPQDSGEAEDELEAEAEGEDTTAKKKGALAKKGQKKGAAAAGLDALSRLREKMKAAEAEAESETEAETRPESEAIGAEEAGFTEDAPAEDRMSALRKQLKMSAPEDGENSIPEAPAGKKEKSPVQEVTVTDTDEAASAPVPSTTVAAASEGVKKFMERRKNKILKAAAAKAPADPAARSAAVYLGVFVSISDALAQETESGIAIPRVLKTFEESFGDCTALCTGLPDNEGAAEVMYCAPSSPDAQTRIQLNSGIFEPITTGDGGPDDLLGYLFLRAKGGRSVFSDAEQATIKKVARKIWAILKRGSVVAESEAA